MILWALRSCWFETLTCSLLHWGQRLSVLEMCISTSTFDAAALPRAVQLLAKKADVWDEGIEQLFKDWVKGSGAGGGLRRTHFGH